MLSGGKLDAEQITLVADGEKSAQKIAQVLIGKSTGDFFITAPYQERVDVEVDGTSVILKKTNTQPFTYEEIKQIGRPLRTHWREKAGPIDELITLARKSHEAPLTFFYPALMSPLIEITYLLNRVLLQINVPYVKKMHMSVADAIQKTTDGKVKVYSNHHNALSLVHDSIDGLFLSYKTYCAIGDALCAASLMPEDAVEDFAIKAVTAGLKCTAFLQARQLCVDADQTFEPGDFIEGNIIEKQGMKPVLSVLSVLSKHGLFSDLSSDQLEFLFVYVRNKGRIREYDGSEAAKHVIRALIENFPEEISHTSSKTATTIEMNEKGHLLGNENSDEKA